MMKIEGRLGDIIRMSNHDFFGLKHSYDKEWEISRRMNKMDCSTLMDSLDKILKTWEDIIEPCKHKSKYRSEDNYYGSYYLKRDFLPEKFVYAKNKRSNSLRKDTGALLTKIRQIELVPGAVPQFDLPRNTMAFKIGDTNFRREVYLVYSSRNPYIKKTYLHEVKSWDIGLHYIRPDNIKLIESGDEFIVEPLQGPFGAFYSIEDQGVVKKADIIHKLYEGI